MSKRLVSITRTVTNLTTGESTVYKQLMGSTMYINIGVSNSGDSRFFVDSKHTVTVGIDEYEQLLNALSEHIVIAE